MNPRVLVASLVAFVVVCAVLIVLSFAQPASNSIADGVVGSGSRYEGAARDTGGPPLRSPDFNLPDERGRMTSISQFRGRPVIVTFVYSTCEDTCPATGRQVAQALDEIKQPVATVLISVDPKSDTPQLASQFLNKTLLAGRARYILGSRAQLLPLWKKYAVSPQTLVEEHQGTVLVLDREGRQRVSWPVDKLTSKGLAHDVRVVAALPPA